MSNAACRVAHVTRDDCLPEATFRVKRPQRRPVSPGRCEPSVSDAARDPCRDGSTRQMHEEAGLRRVEKKGSLEGRAVRACPMTGARKNAGGRANPPFLRPAGHPIRLAGKTDRRRLAKDRGPSHASHRIRLRGAGSGREARSTRRPYGRIGLDHTKASEEEGGSGKSRENELADHRQMAKWPHDGSDGAS